MTAGNIQKKTSHHTRGDRICAQPLVNMQYCQCFPSVTDLRWIETFERESSVVIVIFWLPYSWRLLVKLQFSPLRADCFLKSKNHLERPGKPKKLFLFKIWSKKWKLTTHLLFYFRQTHDFDHHGSHLTVLVTFTFLSELLLITCIGMIVHTIALKSR